MRSIKKTTVSISQPARSNHGITNHDGSTSSHLPGKNTSVRRRVFNPRILHGLLASSLLLFFLPSVALQSRTVDEGVLSGIQIPELNFTPPRVDSRDLTGYATLYRLSDKTLPVVRLRIVIEGGLDLEPVEQAGNLGAMASMLETIGTSKLSPEDRAGKLALLGASISTSVSDQAWEIQLSAMREDFVPALQILRAILTDPRFDEDSLATTRNQMVSAIRSRTDSPNKIGFLALSDIMNPDTRRGYAIQESDVAALQLEKIEATFRQRLATARYHIALDGDFQGLGIERQLIEILRELPVPTRPYSILPDNAYRFPDGENQYRGRILHVTGDFPQALLIIASPTVAHNTDDFYTVQLGNHILGGGSFTSRLMQEIRVKRGLAYYAYSFNQSLAGDGYLAAVSATRSDRAAETLSIMLQEIEGMKTNVTEADLAQARTAILNSLVFLYDNPSDILADYIRFRMDDMPANYLQQFPERMKQVRAADIRRVFQAHLKREELFIVVVGPAELAKELRNIAPVLSRPLNP